MSKTPPPKTHKSAKDRHGQILGDLPSGFRRVKQNINTERRLLEREVESIKGEVSPTAARVILTAMSWSQHAQYTLKLLRDNYASMSIDQKVAFSREICNARTKRDKAIESLGLNHADLAGPTFTLPIDPTDDWPDPTDDWPDNPTEPEPEPE